MKNCLEERKIFIANEKYLSFIFFFSRELLQFLSLSGGTLLQFLSYRIVHTHPRTYNFIYTEKEWNRTVKICRHAISSIFSLVEKRLKPIQLWNDVKCRKEHFLRLFFTIFYEFLKNKKILYISSLVSRENQLDVHNVFYTKNTSNKNCKNGVSYAIFFSFDLKLNLGLNWIVI